MEAEELLAESIDKSQVPPLHQKRILAFVNHFLISSCSFLNKFAINCETKLLEIERKMEKVEAALTILEAKLASVPDVELPPDSADGAGTNKGAASAVEKASPIHNETNEEANDGTSEESSPPADGPAEQEAPAAGVRARDDERYEKFFKMLQFGVPAGAVRMKMQSVGVDPTILDNPDAILPDGKRS